MTTSEVKLSPMMAQWQECKNSAPDAIVFFRLGDFYEAFHDDAVICSKELELTLTKRQSTPMSGVPSHTLDAYVDKLVSKGYKVAIVEQVGEAKEAKGLVQREITRIVTVGTLVNSSLIAEKSHHYIASITEVGKQFGIAFFDLTCADCRVIEVDLLEDAFNELYRFQPKEIIASQKMQSKYPAFFQELKISLNCLVEWVENWRFDHELAYRFLTRELKARSLDGFGLKGMVAAINAAGALLGHIKETLRTSLGPVQAILPYTKTSFMSIDKTTMRNLDLIPTTETKSKKHTLLHVLDHTETPMGGRLLKRWITEPLMDLEKIHARHDALEALIEKDVLVGLKKTLSQIRDLERLTIKMAQPLPSPRDIVALKNSLKPLDELKQLLALTEAPLLQQNADGICNFFSIYDLVERALIEEAPLRLSDGGAFKAGYSTELDTLAALAADSKEWMLNYQNTLRESTGIKTLKVGYTKISGFYIEVSKGGADKVPPTFHRRQTLTNAERYMAPELKAYEEKILTAEDKMRALEANLFQDLKEKIEVHSNSLLEAAVCIAIIDCLTSLASVAKSNHYVRPSMGLSQKLEIIDGRHPVIETAILHEKFIPNDTLLDERQNRLMLITGPNMAGKSTYIRQVALIVIMAQMGSFVPAKSAKIDLIDKVFSRIGASDDLSRGQSTFMVEMIETAFILHHTTNRSLVILDEIGRGTSTYDGISLAWSIAEYLLTTPEKTPKTLFATHYWELTKLEEKVPGAQNYNVAVHESGDQVLFLRKIVKGGTDKSYGIHVARLAGLPSSVLMRASDILLHLEENANQKTAFETPRNKRLTLNIPPPPKEVQLSLLANL